MSSSKKKNRNEEYVASEFSCVSSASTPNDGKTTVSSSGGAQRMRESFLTHFITVAFGYLNENAAAVIP